jgi:hypothetical protein
VTAKTASSLPSKAAEGICWSARTKPPMNGSRERNSFVFRLSEDEVRATSRNIRSGEVEVVARTTGAATGSCSASLIKAALSFLFSSR